MSTIVEMSTETSPLTTALACPNLSSLHGGQFPIAHTQPKDRASPFRMNRAREFFDWAAGGAWRFRREGQDASGRRGGAWELFQEVREELGNGRAAYDRAVLVFLRRNPPGQNADHGRSRSNVLICDCTGADNRPSPDPDPGKDGAMNPKECTFIYG